jgi:hypothetical protein
MLSRTNCPEREKDESSVGSELGKDDEEPAEKIMRFGNIGREEPSKFSAHTSSVSYMENEIPQTLSKRQLKKLRKKQKWLAYKPVKR